jgi:hypothetical protein
VRAGDARAATVKLTESETGWSENRFALPQQTPNSISDKRNQENLHFSCSLQERPELAAQ